MTTWDQIPPVKDQVRPVPASGPYPWWKYARELEERFPDWIITFDTQVRQFSALCWKYLDLGWIHGHIPEHMASIIQDVMDKRVEWDAWRR